MRKSGIAYDRTVMCESSDDDDHPEILPIELDRETVRRLARFSRVVGDHPLTVAAALLHDVLKDDELAHGGETIPAGTPKH